VREAAGRRDEGTQTGAEQQPDRFYTICTLQEEQQRKEDEDASSDFPARLGLKAGSTARLLVACGLNIWSRNRRAQLLGASAYHGLQAVAS
jgi:hypothetical protein